MKKTDQNLPSQQTNVPPQTNLSTKNTTQLTIDTNMLSEVTKFQQSQSFFPPVLHSKHDIHPNNFLSSPLDKKYVNKNMKRLSYIKATLPLSARNASFTAIQMNDPQSTRHVLGDSTIENTKNNKTFVCNSKENLLPLDNSTIMPHYDIPKYSTKANGVVLGYSANTNQGIVRNYNEDRVSIILNILKPSSRQNEVWPYCSFFGIYDGHGGSGCADFLRDNLHQFVIKDLNFPYNPKQALINGFAEAEEKFCELAQGQNGQIDRSGSCAIVVLVVGDHCFVANVGDSRAILSAEQGKKVYALSKDHKPEDVGENKRIVDAGGKTYFLQMSKNGAMHNVGPLRVFPGRLSVCRTFGDIEAKLEKFGGNPNVVIATPEIKNFKLTKEHDFLLMASDGIFDKISSKDAIREAWAGIQIGKAEDIHRGCSFAVESVMREAILKKTIDNITVVLIAFQPFKIPVTEAPGEKENSDPNFLKSVTSKTNKKENMFFASVKLQNPN